MFGRFIKKNTTIVRNARKFLRKDDHVLILINCVVSYRTANKKCSGNFRIKRRHLYRRRVIHIQKGYTLVFFLRFSLFIVSVKIGKHILDKEPAI